MTGYDFTNRVIVVTGGTGVLGGEIVSALLDHGATVALLSRNLSKGKKTAEQLAKKKGKCLVYEADVLDRKALEKAASDLVSQSGRIDGLINAAGGNNPKATTSADLSFFDLGEKELSSVSDLNIEGTILPSQVFGRQMAAQKEGVILNISSMSAFRPLTRVPAYSAAKAAISNFTQWLAVHMAQEYSPNIRVNAIAPGFFLTEQNRFLLTDADSGELTPRGTKIIEHTPLGRFGNPHDLVGAVLWLMSPASKFVTGIVIPIDGGFSAYSGV